MCRSSHRRMSVNKGVLTLFPKFIGKHLCQSFFYNKDHQDRVFLFKTPYISFHFLRDGPPPHSLPLCSILPLRSIFLWKIEKNVLKTMEYRFLGQNIELLYIFGSFCMVFWLLQLLPFKCTIYFSPRESPSHSEFLFV